jgi:hypothetical protein
MMPLGRHFHDPLFLTNWQRLGGRVGKSADLLAEKRLIQGRPGDVPDPEEEGPVSSCDSPKC